MNIETIKRCHLTTAEMTLATEREEEGPEEGGIRECWGVMRRDWTLWHRWWDAQGRKPCEGSTKLKPASPAWSRASESRQGPATGSRRADTHTGRAALLAKAKAPWRNKCQEAWPIQTTNCRFSLETGRDVLTHGTTGMSPEDTADSETPACLQRTSTVPLLP